MSKISQITPREILDSRGNPTVEVEIMLEDGSMGMAAVPSGASTGSKEAIELRDGGKRYLGKGVAKAVKAIQENLAFELIGMPSDDYRAVDQKMIDIDGTENKSKIGANAILAISLANARAAANSKGVSLYSQIAKWMGNDSMHMPVPMMNIVNGGVHADNTIDIQEFMIQPVGASNFADALCCGVEVFHTLKGLLKKANLATSVGDEGGFAPDLPSSQAVLELLSEAITKAGYQTGKDVTLALDCASNEIYSDKIYKVEGKELDNNGMIDYLAGLCENFPVVSIEDGLHEDDWEGWKALTKKLGDKVQLVGDDLFVTNEKYLRQGIDKGVANAILIKLNQIGTLSETIDCITTAHKAGYATVISHRSGETEDSFIADLAVGSGSKQIKTGSLCRSDRVAKYNQLLRIQQGRPSISYVGKKILRD